jgi:hypothetical protein
MLLVPTTLTVSPIEGLGVFAAALIRKGTPTWRFIHGFDLIFPVNVVEAAAEPIRSTLLRYAYRDRNSGLYVYCIDNARFVNHSDNANTEGVYTAEDPFGLDVATRDIQPGEEITCNYLEFDHDHARKLLNEF